MEEKFIKREENDTYEIIKQNEENITIEELYNVLKELMRLGKNDYKIYSEGFCVGIDSIEICDKKRKISF